MKVSIDWLREYIDIDIPIAQLGTKLTEQGVSVEGITKIGGDYIFDLEITPNRPDLLSVFGIAREIKVMLRKPFKKNPFNTNLQVDNSGCDITVEIEDKKDCPRYAGCLLENIKVEQSPDWLKQRLSVSGIRSVNNVVDVTNYVLLEMGHPLHGFDAEVIKGRKIKVRRASGNESIITLDSIERKLDVQSLVIADAEKPIAIAGIMGGENSEIREETRNIFIESAYFKPTLIRRGAKKFNISTESSYRFERKADIDGLIPALLRAKELLIKLCKGNMKGGITDTYEGKKLERKKVNFSIKWLNGFLGSDFSTEEIKKPLISLGFDVKGDTLLEVEIPSFRRDIAIKEDIAEEVIRIRGFEKIPLMNRISFNKVTSLPNNSLKINRIKEYFISQGYDEAVNISFLSSEEIKFLNSHTIPIEIKNPIASNLTLMRPTLLPGLLKTVKKNINIGVKDIRIFESGNVFIHNSDKDKINEMLRIAGVLTGKVKEQDWRGENREYDYYDIKGNIEGLFDYVRIGNISFRKKEDLPALLKMGSNLYIGKDRIGYIGSLSNKARDFLDIPQKVFLFELELAHLLDHISFARKFTTLPRYPGVLRDISLIVPKNVTHQQIEDIIKMNGIGLVERIELFDTYHSKKFTNGSRSLTYSITFRSPKETLNDEKVSRIVDGISNAFAEKLGIKLRGSE